MGQRVEDITQTSTTDEAYGAGGNLLLRYTGDSNSRSFVPFGGGILAEYYCGGMIFDHPDEIGSATTATDCTGNTVNEKLFYPFGEFRTGALIPSLGAHQTFAQLPDYDPETDQYNTANRHYSPSGRWLSPDPGGVKVVKLDDPQTWNMYAYARNNPTTMSDPSGLIEGNSNGGSDPDAHAKLNLQDRVQCGNQYCPPQAQGDQTKTQPDTKPQEQQAQQTSTDNTLLAQNNPPPALGQNGQPQTTKQLTGDATEYNLPGANLAYGGKYDSSKMAAAMTPDRAKNGQTVTVTYTTTDKNGNSVTTTIRVVVNDTGPFARGTNGRALQPLRPDPKIVIDLTPTAMKALTGSSTNRVPVTVTVPQ